MDRTDATLHDALVRRAREHPNEVAYVLLRGERTAVDVTFAEVHDRARAVAGALADAGAAGERVLLAHGTGLEYIAGFFGALLAGAVPVSSHGLEVGRLETTMLALDAIAADTGARFAVGSSRARQAAERERERTRALAAVRWLTPEDVSGPAPDVDPPAAGGGDTAYLQYTSGSTSAARGVVLTHDNILSNLQVQRELVGVDADTTIVSWLPLSHDMGFMGPVLHPIATGCRSVLMSAVAFVVRPHRWLQAISTYRGTVAGGPNFGYELIARRVTPEQLDGADLSSWNAAMNGAEPIRAATLDRFTELCAPFGFSRSAFMPAFGMAEVVCMATGSTSPRRPTLLTVDRAALRRGDVLPPADGEDGQRLVGCGHAATGHAVAIVDTATRRRLDDGRVGEIWVAGPSVGHGYWGREAENDATFHARLADDPATAWLRTGDLGFVRDGELFVTGRLKDVIVVRGLNHMPQDLEATAAACDASLSPDGIAAFAAHAAEGEGCALAVELDEAAPVDRTALAERIRRALTLRHGLTPLAVTFVAPGALPRTASGKIRRSACHERFPVADSTGDLAPA